MSAAEGGADGAAPIRQAIAACRAHLWNAAIFSALLNLLYLAPSLYMLQVYDRVVPTRGVPTLLLITLVFLFAIATLATLDLLRARLLIRASARLDRMLAGPLIERLLRSPEAELGRNAALLREFDTLRQTITGPGVLALFDAPWSPIYVIVCFLLHPWLGVLALVCSLVLLAITLLNERSTKEPVREAVRAQQQGYQAIDASVAGAGVIRSLGMQPGLVTRHLRDRAVAARLHASAAFTGTHYLTATKAARITMQSLALGLGALLAIEQQISAGAIFAASLLVSRALAPIEGVTGAWRGIIQARTAWRNINTLFDETSDPRSPTRLPAVQGRVDVEQLVVRAPGQQRVVLQGVSFRIEPGEMVGVIGPSGAGKSTLVRTMVGAQGAASGAVRVDGAVLHDWPAEQLSAAIGYVPQEATLFRGTIKDNIARFQTALANDPAALDAEVVRVAQLCGAHEFILRLPEAYDTELGWGGTGLSVGQAQRIALARALFGGPRIVVLDEPNANLDADGERKLVATLAQLKHDGVTIVLVAHRAAILAACDKLALIRDGKLELWGKREDVLRALAGGQTITDDRAPPAQKAQ